MVGGGRKILDLEMELELAEWWINQVSEKQKSIPLGLVKKRARINS